VEGLEKVPLGHPGQVDFPFGQVTVDFHLPDEQGIMQAVCQLNH